MLPHAAFTYIHSHGHAPVAAIAAACNQHAPKFMRSPAAAAEAATAAAAEAAAASRLSPV